MHVVDGVKMIVLVVPTERRKALTHVQPRRCEPTNASFQVTHGVVSEAPQIIEVPACKHINVLKRG